tara:strand:- start:4620 stop:5210 length:591 start_codon:yes stop_codon:yes gene_type:complete
MLTNSEVFLVCISFFFILIIGYLYFRSSFTRRELFEVISESNQFEDNFKDDNFKEPKEDRQELVIFCLKSMDGNDFDSNQLISLMTNLGAKNCDGFFVFYDHEDAEAFRIANLLNPGVIKEDTSTKAIVMVIDLMKVKYPIKSFDKMISMSHLIAEKIEAVICDEKMQPLSVQLIQHLQTKAQEIEYSNNLGVKAI